MFARCRPDRLKVLECGTERKQRHLAQWLRGLPGRLSVSRMKMVCLRSIGGERSTATCGSGQATGLRRISRTARRHWTRLALPLFKSLDVTETNADQIADAVMWQPASHAKVKDLACRNAPTSRDLGDRHDDLSICSLPAGHTDTVASAAFRICDKDHFPN